MSRLRLTLALSFLAACGDDSSPGGGDETGTTEASTTTMSTSSMSTSSTTSEPMTETTTMQDTTTTESTGPTGECPPDSLCLPVPEEGWSAPFTTNITGIDAMPTMCPEGWADGDPGFAGLQASTFDCECTCDNAPEFMCDFDIQFNGGVSCNGANLQTSTVAGEECAVYATGDAQSVRVTMSSGMVNCGAATWAPPMPSTFTTRMDACVPEVGGMCDEGQCVPLPPAPFVGRMCISHEGDVDCPDGSPFSNPYLLADDVDDQRECPCTCASEDPPTCTGTLQAHTGGACGSQIGTSSGVCITGLTNAGSAVVADVNGTANCEVAGEGAPTGEVALVNARTICCTGD